MATPDGNFVFLNAPAAPRTARISPNEWEKHRFHITERFLASKKLADVVTQMQLEHGFRANENQYNYQLRKWGVKKHAHGLIDTPGASPVALQDVHGHQGLRKRSRPSASLRSFSSADSALVKPPMKKLELNFSLSSKPSFDPPVEDTGHGSAQSVSYGPEPTSSATTNTRNTSCLENHEIYETESGPLGVLAKDHNVVSQIVVSTEEACEAADRADAATVFSTLPGSTIDPQRPLRSILFPRTQTRASGRQFSSPPVLAPATTAQTIPSIDRNRPVDTFTDQDIADIKQAAECLAVFCCNREAFELYTTILKRQLSETPYRDTSFWYLVIQCVHTASGPEHVAVVQNIVRREIDRLRASHDVSHAHQFLLHSLLAFLCNRDGNPDGVRQSLRDAGDYGGAHDLGCAALFAHLPADDRSLDLILYRNLLRLQTGDSCDLISPVAFEFTSFGPLPRKKLCLEDHILYRTPGPFEIQEHSRMANPCIRSCLLWCKEALQAMVSLPVTLGVLDLCPDTMGIAWAEANALFIALWERWAERRSFDEPTWMKETQTRMGISASELLLLVCRVIHDPCNAWMPPGPRQSEAELLRRLCERAKCILHEPDITVARRFLNQYVSRNTVTMWPAWRSAAQKLERARMIKCFERALHVRFPSLGIISGDLINSVLVPFKNEVHHARVDEFPAVVPKAQQLSPTLASSLSSIDLSNFKKTHASAALQLRKFARGSSSIPSLLSLWRSGNKMSMAGSSDLSMSLRSMSISGDSEKRKRLSSQVIKENGASVVGGDQSVEGPSIERGPEPDRMGVGSWT